MKVGTKVLASFEAGINSPNLPWHVNITSLKHRSRFGEVPILGDPGAASRDDGIFMGESLQQERESPWALTLTERGAFGKSGLSEEEQPGESLNLRCTGHATMSLERGNHS